MDVLAECGYNTVWYGVPNFRIDMRTFTASSRWAPSTLSVLAFKGCVIRIIHEFLGCVASLNLYSDFNVIMDLLDQIPIIFSGVTPK